MNELWVASRSGSHAGRGFHYQDAVATELAVRAWRGELTLARLIPEGLEDVSLELDSYPLHLQAKSRRAHRGDFSDAELAKAWRHLADRISDESDGHVGLVLERPLAGDETGLERTLAEAADERLKAAVASAVATIVAPEDFLSRAHVLVMPAAPATVVAPAASAAGARTSVHSKSSMAGPGATARAGGKRPAQMAFSACWESGTELASAICLSHPLGGGLSSDVQVACCSCHRPANA